MRVQFFKPIVLTIILAGLLYNSNSVFAQADSTLKVAGFRGSHIYKYKTDYWQAVGKAMSKNFDNYSPAAVWIVSFFQDDGSTQMVFPSDGNEYPNVSFAGTDKAEEYLTKFDSAGIKVWLQVESGKAEMNSLIKLVLNRYKGHKCVTGFGMDAEWYFNNGIYPNNNYGIQVSDSAAESWEKAVKAINPKYSLFLKHFTESHMPPSYRGDIIFVDDSQQFTDLNEMLYYFKKWGNKFSSNRVEYQFGYPDDKVWWSKYANPPKALGEAIRNAIPNTTGLFWVDFTITDVFPLSITGLEPFKVPASYRLKQNYPNPFNPATTIEYSVEQSAQVRLKLYDMLGKEVMTLVNEFKEPGSYSYRLRASTLPAGIYIYRIEAGSFRESKKLVILK